MPLDPRPFAKIAVISVFMAAVFALTVGVTTAVHARIGCCISSIAASTNLADVSEGARDLVAKVIRFDRGASLLHITVPERRLRPGETVTLALPLAARLEFEVVAVTDTAATGRVLLDETSPVPEVGTTVTVCEDAVR